MDDPADAAMHDDYLLGDDPATRAEPPPGPGVW
jgi:hypothetical protein